VGASIGYAAGEENGMDILFWIAVTGLAFYLPVGFDLLRGNRAIRCLSAVPADLPENPPAVSIVVAARNEQRHIRNALQTLRQLDYPDFELVVVNDRSEDATGTILAELAAETPRLSVVEVRELPPGWLGKNHALWLGSQAARGELLLFTDADIYMEPSLVKRAVHLLTRQGLDHLVVSPRMVMPGPLLTVFGLAFMMIFAIFTRPWKARDPASRHHIGIGAFNLVRASAYRAAGGHRAIALRPDDDLKLGKLIKGRGFKQDIAAGPELMRVEWYATLPELVRGLEKNAFAGCDYRLGMAFGGVALHLLLSVWPFAALLVTSGAVWGLNAALVAIILLLQVDCARTNRVSPWYALGWPVGATLFAWIVMRTTWLNLAQGGISWRGTFYPLSELRKNRI